MSGLSQALGIAGAWLAALLACACGQAERAAPPPAEVEIALAQRGSVPDRRVYVGNARAAAVVDVRARVRGYLIEQRFEEGQRVEAGRLLFRIDPAPYEIALAESRAGLSHARANARRTERDLERARELFEGKVLSTARLDERRADRDAAVASVEAAQAEVRAAELNLSYCEVTAPIAGRIGEALIDVGNLVGESGQDTVLARIVQVDPIHVVFAPTENERLAVLKSQREGRFPAQPEGAIPVEIELGDGTSYPHQGLLDYVDPTIDPKRGTVTLRAVVPNPDGALKPGEFVRAIAVLPELHDALLVPERALLEEQGGSYVLVVDDEERVAYRPVELGVVHDGMQQITRGLEVGERVIVAGLQQARPGMTVVVREH